MMHEKELTAVKDKFLPLEELKNNQNEIISVLEKSKGEVISFEHAYLRNCIDKTKKCAEYFKWSYYPLSNKTERSNTFFCKNHHLCLICAQRRNVIKSNEWSNKINALLKVNKLLQVSHLILTIKNKKNIDEAYEALIKYKGKITKIVRSKKYEFNKILGYVGSIEFTKSENGWHGHIHMILLHTENLNSLKLHREWGKISDAAHYIELIDTKSSENQLTYIKNLCKYVSKPSQFSAQKNNIHELNLKIEFFIMCRKKHARLLFSGGLLRGLDKEPNYEKIDLATPRYEGIAIFKNKKYQYRQLAA